MNLNVEGIKRIKATQTQIKLVVTYTSIDFYQDLKWMDDKASG